MGDKVSVRMKHLPVNTGIQYIFGEKFLIIKITVWVSMDQMILQHCRGAVRQILGSDILQKQYFVFQGNPANILQKTPDFRMISPCFHKKPGNVLLKPGKMPCNFLCLFFRDKTFLIFRPDFAAMPDPGLMIRVRNCLSGFLHRCGRGEPKGLRIGFFCHSLGKINPDSSFFPDIDLFRKESFPVGNMELQIPKAGGQGNGSVPVRLQGSNGS